MIETELVYLVHQLTPVDINEEWVVAWGNYPIPESLSKVIFDAENS